MLDVLGMLNEWPYFWFNHSVIKINIVLQKLHQWNARFYNFLSMFLFMLKNGGCFAVTNSHIITEFTCLRATV